jgi:AmiR/NasT family two-component response regulator
MVVEDERIVASAIEEQLRHAGYDVVANVGSGQAAVSKAIELRPDLILMDINLGRGIDGIEASREIGAQQATPIIFLTAYTDNDTIERARSATPFGYLRKPVEEQALKPAIEMALSRRELEAERDALLKQLQDSQAEIEMLRSLLPICAWCNKLRSKEGTWLPPSEYLSESLGAKLTHGMCDACFKDHVKR